MQTHPTVDCLGISSPLISAEATKLLVAKAVYKMPSSVLRIIANQQPLSSVQCLSKIHRVIIVQGFYVYFTQCVYTGSIEHLTLSLTISMIYPWFNHGRISTVSTFYKNLIAI